MTLRERWADLSRRRRRTLIAAVIVGLYALVGFVVIPAVLRAKVPALLAEMLGRPVTIEKIRLNPFALTLAVHGFRIGDTDGEPFVALGELYVNLQSSSVFRRALTLEEVRLTAPQIRLRMLPDGKPSFADIQERLAAGSEPTEAPPPGDPFPIIIRHARIERGKVAVRDESRPTPFEEEIAPIDIAVDDFTTRREGAEDSPYSFSATTENGATLTWQGTLSILPLRSQGEIRLVNFRSRTPWRYLRDDLHFEITSGWADVSARYAFDASSDKPTLRVSDAALSLRGITLFEEGATAPLITLPSFAVSGGSMDLNERTVKIASIASHGTRARVLREADGRLHVEKVFARRARDAAAAGTMPSASPPSAPEPSSSNAAGEATASAPWNVTVESIEISDYGIAFEDRTTPTPAKLTFAPISLRVRDVSTSGSEPAAVDLSIGLEREGRLTVTGTASPRGTSADIAVKLDRFALPLVQPYVGAASGAMLRQGDLGVDLSVSHRAGDDGAKTRCEGRIDLAGLDVGTRSGTDIVRLDALAVEGLSASFEPVDVKIARIELQRPILRFDRRKDGTTNFAEAAAAPGPVAASATDEVAGLPPPAAEPTASAAAVRPLVDIPRIEVTDGAITVTDAGAEPAFTLDVSDLVATVEGVSLDSSARVAVDVKARIERTSSLAVKAVATPNADPIDAEVKITLAGLDTHAFSPYSGRYIGQQIARGKLHLDLDYTVERSELDAKNKILLDGFALGKRIESADAVDLPVGLAVALLKDTRGRINLDVPVSGRLDDPGFHLAPILVDQFRNLILKAATAPFALIGGLVGGGGEELGYIAFAPGRADLAEPERAKLAQLARGLAERPALRVEIPGTASPALDGPALREIALESLLQSMRFEEIRGKSSAPATPAEVVLDDGLRERLLAEAYAGRLNQRVKDLRAQAPATDTNGAVVDPREWTRNAMRRRLLDSMSAGAGEIENLARRRAEAIVDALLKENGVAPERVSTVAPNVDAAGDGTNVKSELVLTAG
jgi:uncharacterized protein involved in outer membrane biogenesis